MKRVTFLVSGLLLGSVVGLTLGRVSASTTGPPEPPRLPDVIGARQVFHDGSIRLDPPDSTTPKISATEALRLVWTREKLGSTATSEQIAFGTLVPDGTPSPVAGPTLAYIVTYADECVPFVGGFDNAIKLDPCGGVRQAMHVYLDANTGEMLARST